MRHNPKLINIMQGTEEWHKWRLNKIGASQVPVIMGESPYQTRFQLWEEKQGLAKAKVKTEAMERGTVLEPHVRKLISDKLDVELTPMCAEHPTLNYFSSSADGISSDGKFLTEIKCGSKKDHEMAKVGLIPPKYKGQLQAHLEVWGLDIIHFAHYNDGDLALVPVTRDFEYIKEMLDNVQEFWQMIQDFTPPPLENKDFVVNDSQEWASKAEEYKSIESMLKDLEKKKDTLRQELLTLTNGLSTMGAGIKVTKILEKGRVDYNKIPELIGVNLDQYRKEPITKWRFT